MPEEQVLEPLLVLEAVEVVVDVEDSAYLPRFLKSWKEDQDQSLNPSRTLILAHHEGLSKENPVQVFQRSR